MRTCSGWWSRWSSCDEETAGYRKGNRAVFVKINMSAVAETGTSSSGLKTPNIPMETWVWRKKVLDGAWEVNIIIFTHTAACSRVPDAGERSQTRSSAT